MPLVGGVAQRRSPAVLGRGGTGTRRHRPDYLLILMAVMLLIIGLVVVYSISPGLSAQRGVSVNYFIGKQLIAILLGGVMFGVAAWMPFSRWKHLQQPLLVLAVVATLVAFILPTNPDYPAHRWIRFGGLSLQSVELVKLSLLVGLASFLTRQAQTGRLKDASLTFKPLLIVLGVIGVVVGGGQSDLGSAGVMVVMMAAMGFVAGLPLKRILTIGGLIAIGGLLLVSTVGYRRDRLLTFLHPERDCQNAGYQACQALIAVGSGGMFGKGLAHSVQAYGYLPEAANDSIFAIMAEKFGFVGVTLLLCLMAALFARLVRIMERAPDNFSRLLVAGVLAWLSTQTLINVGAMLGLLPLKGITLPFISYGGTSIIFVMGILGLVFNISRYTTYGVNSELLTTEESYGDSTGRGRNRRPHYTQLSRRP
jgi:cell division protein FtsW